MTVTELAADYRLALLSLGLCAIIATVQSLLTAPFAFVKGEQAPGFPVRHDYRRLSFRVMRTHANSVESLPAFAVAVLLALWAGADAAWTNALAVAHLALRMAFWALYYGGIGRHAGGPRTFAYLGGALANIALGAIGVAALI